MQTANCNQKGKTGCMAERTESQMVGTPTGFTEVDKLFRGLQGGELIILAARPGAGKTTFALNVATNAAKSGTTVLFFSLEMGGNDITQRILCSEARVSLHQFRQESLQEGDQDADIIMFIDRSENGVEDEINGNGKPGTAELIVAKHRNGPIRDITLRFNPEFARFDNHTDAFRM